MSTDNMLLLKRIVWAIFREILVVHDCEKVSEYTLQKNDIIGHNACCIDRIKQIIWLVYCSNRRYVDKTNTFHSHCHYWEEYVVRYTRQDTSLWDLRQPASTAASMDKLCLKRLLLHLFPCILSGLGTMLQTGIPRLTQAPLLAPQ